MEKLERAIKQALVEDSIYNYNPNKIDEIKSYLAQQGIHTSKDLLNKGIPNADDFEYLYILVRVRQIIENKNGFQDAIFFE